MIGQLRNVGDGEQSAPDSPANPSSLRTIARWEDVPIFHNEEDEAEFWSENRPDLRLMEGAVSGNGESAESVTITLRIDPRMLARIKRMARSRYLNYQSMIKQWLSERMEAELRER
jgi:predicted DNA binding CopG/RHH family protein